MDSSQLVSPTDRSRDSEGSISDLGDDAEFPQPPSKRRRTFDPEVNETSVISSYAAPSRIRKRSEAQDARSKRNGTEKSISKVVSTTDSTFDSLDVSPWLVHSLKSMAVTNPTEIQRTCIPEILKGRDCIGGSRTGTGKTIAFAVPILQKWSEDPFGIYAVILTPTRELALQIYEQFLAIGAPQSLKVVLITGGSEMRPQALALASRPHIVVATPGRLADHIQTSGTDTVIGLKRAKVVVLDEADRLLASGPGSMLPDLNTCLSSLPASTSRLTLLFTATITPEVRALQTLPRPAGRPPVFTCEISDLSSPSSPSNETSLLPPLLTQTYIQCPSAQKPSFLHIFLSLPSLASADSTILIFTNRTSTTDLLHRTLLALDHPVTALHSGLPQKQRAQNLASFRASRSRILLATDVASRGLDIPSITHVINYDLPRDPADYVHRVGRTARAGKTGTAITFVGQRDVERVLAIEEFVGRKMDKWEEEGVNLETRVVRGRVLKDVGEAWLGAVREVEEGRDVNGWRGGGVKKDRRKMGMKTKG